jgi:hypothetical protein
MPPFHPVDFESKSASLTGWEASDLQYAENDDMKRNYSSHILQFTDDRQNNIQCNDDTTNLIEVIHVKLLCTDQFTYKLKLIGKGE